MSDGVQLHVDVVGNGPPILWLPGGPGLDNYLRPVADALPGFLHVLPDPRGTGRSQGRPHGLAVAVHDLEDLRRSLEVERWVVLGHSWGADLALAYGLTHPGPVRAILSFAGTGVQNDREWHAAYEARHSEEPHGEYQHNPAVQSRLIEDGRRFITEPDLLARIARLEVPISFVHPANDIRPGWPARQLAALAPLGWYLELAGAPHEAWLTHHDELLGLLRDVLAAQTTSAKDQL